MLCYTYYWYSKCKDETLANMSVGFVRNTRDIRFSGKLKNRRHQTSVQINPCVI